MWFVRTTIDLPDELHRALKKQAVQRGLTLREMAGRLLEQGLTTRMTSLPDLLDASVWIALSAPEHVHDARARRYWDEEAADDLVFCRATALA